MKSIYTTSLAALLLLCGGCLSRETPESSVPPESSAISSQKPEESRGSEGPGTPEEEEFYFVGTEAMRAREIFYRDGDPEQFLTDAVFEIDSDIFPDPGRKSMRLCFRNSRRKRAVFWWKGWRICRLSIR